LHGEIAPRGNEAKSARKTEDAFRCGIESGRGGQVGQVPGEEQAQISASAVAHKHDVLRAESDDLHQIYPSCQRIEERGWMCRLRVNGLAIIEP
jgi:hypothetical protein